MLDPYALRNRLPEIAARLKTRAYDLPVLQWTELDNQRKAIQIETQRLQQQRNAYAKRIAQAKALGELTESSLDWAESQRINEQLGLYQEKERQVLKALDTINLEMPNLPHPSVPEGLDETANVEIRRWGEQPSFAFTPLSHDTLGEQLGILDFETARKLSGARFVVLKGIGARLQRALIQWMLDVHTQEFGYQEVAVPYLVHEACLYGTGQLPKFKEDAFQVSGQPGYYLISTAEIPVTNQLRDTLVDADTLPLKFVSHTPCFRSEAGAAGRDTRGMIRVHQFEKVELMMFTDPEHSYTALETLTQHAEALLQRLGLPYRVVALSTGDLGFASAKTYDLEVFLPSQGVYREISSCSCFEAFQARRIKARMRVSKSSKETVLLHTLNGSALAVGRTLVAILENYQQPDGSVVIPTVLRPYLGGQTMITRQCT